MLPALIGAGASLLGGLFGQSSQKKQMQAQIDAQREFAQSGIQWKVKDAEKAGVHPLYALGAQTTAFSPIGIGGSPLAEGISQAGQSIQRGMEAKASLGDRAYVAKSQALALQRGELENQLLASQIARINSPTQMPPPLPPVAGPGAPDNWLLAGQTQSMPSASPERFAGPLVQSKALERVVSDPNNPHSEPGAVTDVGWARTARGGWAPVPSTDVKTRIEDTAIPQIAWSLRNMVGPNLSAAHASPPFKAPPGHRWEYSIPDQSYMLIPQSGKGDRLRKF